MREEFGEPSPLDCVLELAQDAGTCFAHQIRDRLGLLRTYFEGAGDGRMMGPILTCTISCRCFI